MEKEIRLNCPNCEKVGKTPDTKKHLYVNVGKGVFHCFRCGWSGRISALPSEILSALTFDPASFLKEEAPSSPSQAQLVLPSGFKQISTEMARKVALDFVARKVGFPVEYVEAKLTPDKVEVVAHSADGSLWLYLKSINHYGEEDYYILRRVNSHEFRNPAGIEKPLFKVDFLSFKRDETPIVLVEGVMDAFAVNFRLGLPAASLLGHTLTEKQLQELYYYRPKSVVVALDPDARYDALRIARKLYSFVEEVYVALLPDGKDPADLSGEIFPYLKHYNDFLSLIFLLGTGEV